MSEIARLTEENRLHGVVLQIEVDAHAATRATNTRLRSQLDAHESANEYVSQLDAARAENTRQAERLALVEPLLTALRGIIGYVDGNIATDARTKGARLAGVQTDAARRAIDAWNVAQPTSDKTTLRNPKGSP